MIVTIFDISMTVIALVSLVAFCLFEIEKYKKGEYNLLIFRFRQGTEWSTKELLTSFGVLIPIGIIQNLVLKDFSYSISLLSILVLLTILNIKSYKLKRDTKIIVQTVIFNIFILGLLLVIIPVFK